MAGTSPQIDSFNAQPTSLAYQTGGAFEVSFDNGVSLFATAFPEQLVSAAYWLRGHGLQVEFDPTSHVIHRIGEFLSDRSVPRRATPRGAFPSPKVRDFASPACINDVATQAGPTSSIFEVFVPTDQGERQFSSSDPVLQMLVETAAMRCKAPLLSVASDSTLLGVELPADAAPCPTRDFSNVGDINYALPDASVTVAPDATVFLTNDPVVLGVLVTARAIGMQAVVEPTVDDPTRIKRIMRNATQNQVSPQPAEVAPTFGCMNFLATDLDANGSVFLTLTTDTLGLGSTYDPLIQILCHGALVGRLLVAVEVDDANVVQSFAVSHRGACD